MSKGYETRIDSIIEKMIDGNIEFNAKPMQQQNKDKEEIAESIANAISNLNDIGQQLVLDELDNRASQNLLEIFDSQGNIKVLELNHLTATIVSSTLQDAQRKGIDLTRNSIINEKDSAFDTILTAVMIDKMIKDYHSLSDDEKDNLIKNYHRMTEKQKDLIIDGILDELETAKESTNDPQKKESISKTEDCLKTARSMGKINDKISDEDKEKIYNAILEQFPEDLRVELKAKYKTYAELQQYIEGVVVKLSRDVAKGELDIVGNEYAGLENKLNFYSSLLSSVREMFKDNKPLNEQLSEWDAKLQKKKEMMNEKVNAQNNAGRQLTEDNPVNQKRIMEVSKSLNMSEIAREIGESDNQIGAEPSIVSEEERLQDLKNTLSKKPISIASALSKVNIPEKDIKESLQLYKEFLGKIEKDDIEKLRPLLGTEQLGKFLHKKLKKFGMDERISEIISKVDYEGQLLDILGNEETREMLLNGLENAVHIEIESDKIEIDDELEEALDLYLVAHSEDVRIAEDARDGSEIQGGENIVFDSGIEKGGIPEELLASFFDGNAVDMEVAEPTTLTEIAGEEFGEENPVGFEDIPQEPVIGMDVDFESDILGMETEEESSIPTSEEGYTETLAAEEMEVEQPQVFDMAGLFDAQTAKDIFGEEGSRADLGQAIDFLNALGKDMQNPNKSKVQDEIENEVTALDDSGNDNR